VTLITSVKAGFLEGTVLNSILCVTSVFSVTLWWSELLNKVHHGDTEDTEASQRTAKLAQLQDFDEVR
jgi:hypothetical protein